MAFLDTSWILSYFFIFFSLLSVFFFSLALDCISGGGWCAPLLLNVKAKITLQPWKLVQLQ